MKHRLCNECYAATGHADWCVSKGYTFVGPHPDAPPDTARAPVRTGPVELCCGGTRNRVGCEYHDPSLQPKPAYEVYDTVQQPLSTMVAVGDRLDSPTYGSIVVLGQVSNTLWLCSVGGGAARVYFDLSGGAVTP